MNLCFNYKEKIINIELKNKRYNINKYNPTAINSIEFVNQHSVSDDKLLFTNKLQRNNGTRIEILKKVIYDLIKRPNNLDYYFDGRDISMQTKNDINKLQRLDKILKLYDFIPDNELIFKYAPNARFFRKYLKHTTYERGFQLFFTRNNTNDVKVYLIDLYHLAIPSKKNKLRSEYVDRMNYKKDIFDCIFYKIVDINYV